MPLSSMPAKACGAAAARTASTATWTLPSVRFLKPIGIERPEPSWRWIWLSVVRAPIAPQATRVGDVLRRDRVEELAADRQAEVEHLEQQLAGDPQAGVDVAGAVEVRVVDQALPAGRRPRLLEVDPHHDQQVVARAPRAVLGEPRRRTRAPLRRRGRCTARRRPAARSSSPVEDVATSSRPRTTACRAPRRAAAPRAARPAAPARRLRRSAGRGPGLVSSSPSRSIILPSPFSKQEIVLSSSCVRATRTGLSLDGARRSGALSVRRAPRAGRLAKSPEIGEAQAAARRRWRGEPSRMSRCVDRCTVQSVCSTSRRFQSSSSRERREEALVLGRGAVGDADVAGAAERRAGADRDSRARRGRRRPRPRRRRRGRSRRSWPGCRRREAELAQPLLDPEPLDDRALDPAQRRRPGGGSPRPRPPGRAR